MPVNNLPEAFLDMLIHPLANMLLQTSQPRDSSTAVKNALDVVRAFNANSEAEIRLAIRIAMFSIQANIALAQADMPDLPLSVVIRLRQGAVTLTREADKAERWLHKLQAARRKGEAPPAKPPQQPEKPSVERAQALIQDIEAVEAMVEAEGIPANQAYRLRNREKRRARQQEREARLRALRLAEQDQPPAATAIGAHGPATPL
jgi:hypothetical protein